MPYDSMEMHVSKRTIGSLLLQAGKIQPDDAEQIIKTQHEYGLKFGDAALKLGLVTEEDIQQAVSKQFDFESLETSDESIDKRVIAAFQSFGSAVESLRGVRSQLTLRWFTDNKLLVIAPVQGQEGASYTASNLAVLFSQMGMKTLLIDANMRTPAQSDLFRNLNKLGLSDVIAGRADMSVITQHPVLTNLSVMSSGTVPPNPLELLNHPVVKTMLRELQHSYEIILLDAPPVLVHCDALTLSSLCGGIMLMAKKGKTSVSAVEEAKQRIFVAGAQPVGVVLNEFK